MSHPHSRKTFFAKLIGILAASGVLVPRLAAGRPRAALSTDPARKTKPPAFAFNRDPRTVSRTDSSE